MTSKLLITSLIIVSCYFGNAQEITNKSTDSLLDKEFSYLEYKMLETPDDTLKSVLYATAYLNKAKRDKRQYKVIDGYYLLSLFTDYHTALKYADSTIYYTTNSNIQDFLGVTHLQKGFLHWNHGEYEKALSSYLEAEKNIDKKTELNNYILVTHNIGLLRLSIGQNSEALEEFKTAYNYILENESEEKEVGSYLNTITLGLAEAYLKNNKLDSATTYNLKGIQKSKAENDKEFYPKFLATEGINLFKKKEYEVALDSISKSIPLLEVNKDSLYLAYGLLYKGQVLYKKLEFEESIASLKRVDTIISKLNQVDPDFLVTYELLNDYAKKSENPKNQLFYLEKLIDYDKSVKSTFKNLYQTLTKEYDTPQLLSEKTELINTLETQNESKTKRIYFLSILMGIFGIVSYYYYRTKSVYKKRYEQLISSGVAPKKKKAQGEFKKHSIPENLKTVILKHLDDFENDRGFLDGSITLNSLAKRCKTNSNYLSKIINNHKQKNFSNYITDLRVDYAIADLQVNPKLRSYTIKAIATEVGFKNTESFTKAFHKNTGIYPSYYLKRLKRGTELV